MLKLGQVVSTVTACLYKVNTILSCSCVM